ncbi:MAG TPA: cytochrome c oxidase assembly protein [Gemmatimonadaceae bacterium]|nr:cytochrome c oxidase assembly protein [Gemmatimonadaceae bacterium]
MTRVQAARFAGGVLRRRYRHADGGVASPVDAPAETLFSAHMVQHLLLILAAAPLLALGAPLLPMREMSGSTPWST